MQYYFKVSNTMYVIHIAHIILPHDDRLDQRNWNISA